MSDDALGELPAEPPDWVPQLILMADYGHSFPPYIEAVYAIFRQAFIATQPQFQGRWVRCRRDPIYDGKEAGFWHCTSEGQQEDERIPDIRRCERIRWLRAVIENHTDDRIDVWHNELRGDMRYSLWFNEEYLIVLGDRRHTWQLITAFTTDQEHRRRKLRKERDESQEEAGNG